MVSACAGAGGVPTSFHTSTKVTPPLAVVAGARGRRAGWGAHRGEGRPAPPQAALLAGLACRALVVVLVAYAAARFIGG